MVLKKKDGEVERYKQQVEELKQEMAEYDVDTDRASVATLTKAVQDRDKQIQLLKTQYVTATNQMNDTAQLVESLQQQMRAGLFYSLLYLVKNLNANERIAPTFARQELFFLSIVFSGKTADTVTVNVFRWFGNNATTHY